MRSVLWLIVPLLALATIAKGAAAAPPNCFEDNTISVCVKSAVVMPLPDRNPKYFWAKVALNFEIVNKTEYPIDMMLDARREQISLSPENADGLLNDSHGGFMQISGLKFCYSGGDCEKPQNGMTTLSPKTPYRVQVGYKAQLVHAAKPQLEIASKATLSATLYVSQRGAPLRAVPIPTGEFPFNNGYAR